MTDPTQNTQIARTAILHLNPVFWGKPRIASFVWAFTQEVQELEDAIWSVINKRLLENADDHQLAILGRIVGQPNLGFGTELYRDMIEARALINRTRGGVDDVLRALALVYAGAIEWSSPSYNTLVFAAVDASGLDALAARIIVRDAKAAGVRGLLEISTVAAPLEWGNGGSTTLGSSTDGSGSDCWHAEDVGRKAPRAITAFATNANYDQGPEDGNPTKSAPSDNGFLAGAEFEPEEFNYVANELFARCQVVADAIPYL